MSRYQGLIDFALLSPLGASLPIESERGVSRVTLPGLQLQWNADFATAAYTDGVIALACGRRRRAAAANADALRWIERYARHDREAAKYADGEFAVGIIDLNRQRVALFVDRFSIQTLCYRTSDERFAFADSACNVPESNRVLSAQSIYDYLYFHVIPAPETVFRDVRRVPAAHAVIASANSAQASAYWEPVFVEDDRRDLPGRLRQFVEIVKHSVEEEMDGARVACFLSGGTDSSTIAGMLTRLAREPVHAYSIGFDAAGYDEMAYARIAARHFGLVHHEYYVTPDDLVSAIPKLAAAFDQPFGNSSVLPAYLCALRAKEDGFDRMLAGDGGDELFAGNSRYAMQQLFELYHTLPRTLRQRLLEPVAMNWTLFKRVPGLKQIGGYVRHSHVPMPDRLNNFQLLNRIGEETVLAEPFRTSINPENPLQQQRNAWAESSATSLLNRMLAYDWKFTLAENDLPKIRNATQLADVCVGYPFLSRALVDFSLSLPPEWKLKRLKLRWFFKEALRDFLPAEIIHKKKHGFGLPFGHWALRHRPLRELVEASLESVGRRGFVQPRFTRELFNKWLPEAPGYYGETVWILMMLEQWLRSHDTQ